MKHELEEPRRGAFLTDDRARTAVRNFHRQWLYLDRVLDEDKVQELFPMWQGSPVRESAKEETLRFIENTFFDGGTVEGPFHQQCRICR